MTRPVDVARLALGVAALAVPGGLLPAAAETRTSRTLTRVLGARYLAQGGLRVVGRKPWSAEVDAGVDALHAASMVGLAVLSSRYRRVALVSAAAAAAFASADLRGQR